MKISKNIEALLRGYVLFKVNGKRFSNYEDARAERVRITDASQPVEFKGLHIFKGWQWFYYTVFLRKAYEASVNCETRPSRARVLASTPNIVAVAEV
jgi:hypothetical protein